jgi:hypothetical protein
MGRNTAMPTSRKINPNRSYAVIIGASEYDDHPNYPNVRGIKESAEQFKTLITKETMWGLPPGNVKLLRGRVTVLDAARAIREAARRSDVDGLFVYLCAHGRRWDGDHVPDRGLHFALSDSQWDLPINHLPFVTVREMLTRESKAAATVLIIDSCYADGSFLSGADPLQPPSIPGVCTLISTKRRVRADSTWRDTSYTAFSGALIQIIEKGINGPAEYLTPDAIFPELRQLLKAYSEPDMRVSGTSVFLCKNNDYRPVTNELERDELFARLDRPEAVDPAAYATAVEHALGPAGERDDAKQLITAFGTNRPAAETLQLANLLRSRGKLELNQLADRLIHLVYACRSGAEITELLHLLHRQNGDDIAADEVLRKLSQRPERPAEVTADLSAELRDRECADCAVIGARIDDQMLAIWPKPRLVELLVALH